MVSIIARPAEVEDRKVPGHWEGDLVMGTRPSAVATLVERTSRCTTIVALPDGMKAEQVTPHLTRSLLGIPPHLRRTLTWDCGREIAEHQAITTETRMPIYLCKPRSPWQRGTNENTNGLLRQYPPRAPTSARSATPTWTPSLTNSTTVRARHTATSLRQRSALTS
ncbi:IS30 family transposase [Streptomyces phaeochromogenes]|uniref:IS30 family transposase n=1 Tax=Streptomyces phaeochromogenes TaxID=1923 RepID=A0ABZ1HUU9_STRPH|nr:IS30 family transposase [Streptomyces phaeochromogenes]WSD20959.1 IS30 family transposase [Streptomyces phaeochromogenes]